MAGLVGEFEVRLDGKGRFLFPASLRKQLSPEAQEQFMLNKGFEECLTLYPMNEWDKLAGRVLIPVMHMERVGLDKEVMLIAYNDRIEIWDKSKYFQLIDGNMADFADLADEVMGDLGNDDE
jgi:MraZ protein